MLTHHIGYAFGFDFAGVAVFGDGCCDFAVFYGRGVQHGMGSFVNQCFERLCLAHIRSDIDALLQMTVTAFGAAAEDGIVVVDGYGRKVRDSSGYPFILRHIAGKLADCNGGQFFALGLANVKDGNDLERLLLNDYGFFYRIAVCISNRLLAVRVDLLGFDHAGIRARCKNADAFFTFLDATVKVLLPCVKARYTRCGRVLHGNEQHIAEAVMMEFRHRFEIFRVAFAGKQFGHAVFQLVHQLFQPFRRRWII